MWQIFVFYIYFELLLGLQRGRVALKPVVRNTIPDASFELEVLSFPSSFFTCADL